jgi:hypothetical protein
MSRIRNCKTSSFFSGQSVCEIDYDKIRGMVLVEHGSTLDYTSLANLRSACHADLPNRAYGFPAIINWEPSGGEAQVSQVGYGPNAYNGMSARTDAFTLDAFRHYLRAQILNNANKVWDMYLIDGRNNLYGLSVSDSDTLAGIPVTIYPSGNDHAGASDKAQLIVNVVYQDVEDYMMRLDVVPLDFEALTAIYGLMPVTLEKQGSSGSNYKVVEYYGKGDATAKYGALLAGTNATSVMDDISAATYDATNNVISVTLAQNATAPVLKKASVLCTNGIYGIEPKS